MFGQTFATNDIATVGVLLVLEALLSADNALVLAILVRHLPKPLQKKALLYGLGGAFTLRCTAIVLATYIISFWWLQLIGALYLLYLPFKHFHSVAKNDGHAAAKARSFWATVAYLELVDLAFALDSVIVAVAVVDTVRHPDKTWVVFAGAILGIILLRFAARFFIKLLEKYPMLDHVAYALVGWAGVKLLLISGHSFDVWYTKRGGDLPFHIPQMPTWLFWIVLVTIASVGTILAVRNPSPPSEDEDELETVDEILS
ncbi:MAG TPA: TerC family protein [Fimbriimonadaceae bacterium]|nr:TerC family protein [Fimbriimonadaceae bacterium]